MTGIGAANTPPLALESKAIPGTGISRHRRSWGRTASSSTCTAGATLPGSTWRRSSKAANRRARRRASPPQPFKI